MPNVNRAMDIEDLAGQDLTYTLQSRAYTLCRILSTRPHSFQKSKLQLAAVIFYQIMTL